MNYNDFYQRMLATNHKIPQFRISVSSTNGEQNITQEVSQRLMQLTLIDNRGFEADELDLQLSDHDGKLMLPSRGAKIEVAIGWKGQQLIPKGSYIVDEIQYSGTPDSLTIRAKSADMRGTLHSKKERSFHNMTFGKLIEQIAQENGLAPLCHQAFKDKAIDHLDQTNESTINLLSRLAEENDAIATVKNGKLLFMPAGKGKTATDKPLPPIHITRQSGDSFNFSLVESDNYTAVRAYWHNLDTGKKGEVVFDKNSKIERKTRLTKGRKRKDGTVTGQRQSKRKYNQLVQTEPVETDANQMKTLRHTYKTEAAALNAAKAAFEKIQRGVATFSLNLAQGNPELMPELPVTVQGFKAMIDSSQWIITKVTHSIGGSGFTSAVELELKVEETEK
ncbi:phage late control D family protein [Avibacterium paragallinarum]|uniref:phage late control D family protein n=1 Tax=Avibacterium paragallinarum TaxID=728 RepID=UPI0021F6A380|nr:phage late control D family protein [Avibacterium paragallinarum]UXN37812.1 phage late control D family protein [Avibacterium paragallinarum]